MAAVVAVDREPKLLMRDHPMEAEWPPVAGGDRIERASVLLASVQQLIQQRSRQGEQGG